MDQLELFVRRGVNFFYSLFPSLHPLVVEIEGFSQEGRCEQGFQGRGSMVPRGIIKHKARKAKMLPFPTQIHFSCASFVSSRLLQSALVTADDGKRAFTINNKWLKFYINHENELIFLVTACVTSAKVIDQQ